MTEANAGMQNLKGFAVYGDEIDPKTGKRKVDKEASLKNVERYYQEKGKAAIPAKAALQSEEYNRNKYREAGISDEEYERTSGGKQQMKRLAEAGQGVIDTDPRMQGEKKGAIIFGEDRGDESLADKLNVSEEESSQLKAIESASEPVKELINITKTENERKTKADSDLLAAIQNMQAAAGGGGALSSIADAASLIGGKGKTIGRGAKYLSKVGGIGKLAKGIGIGAVGALAGEGIQMGGDKLKEAGYEKTGKAVGVAGTATKYAGYGAMIGSVIPGVGTAIGAGVGGVIGAGKGIYDQYYKASPKSATASNKENHSMRMDTSDPNRVRFLVDGKEVSEKDYMAIQNGPVEDQPKAIRTALNNADRVAAQSSDNAIAKTPSNSQPSNTIVNAPTNVSKQTQNNSIKVPVRDQDHSIKSYYRSRFAT